MVERDELLGALPDDSDAIVLHLEAGAVAAHGCLMPASYSGTTIDVVVRTQFLRDAVEAMPSTPVVIEASGPYEPLAVHPGDDDSRLHLVMPIKVPAG